MPSFSIVLNRWEKAGLRTVCCTLPSYRRARSTDKRRPAMKKVSTAAAEQSRNFSLQKLTIGLDLGDRSKLLLCFGRGRRCAAGATTRQDAQGDAMYRPSNNCLTRASECEAMEVSFARLIALSNSMSSSRSAERTHENRHQTYPETRYRWARGRREISRRKGFFLTSLFIELIDPQG
jgi:hypothetical protein